MNIITLDNYNLMSGRAADFVIEVVSNKSDAVLALPTGHTPLGMYQELCDEVKQGELSFAEVRTFNLDDYVGVSKDYQASFYQYMKTNFFDKVDLQTGNIYMLDGTAEDLFWACEDYERSLQEVGGIDLAILGIGLNGHIAYNEPGTDFDSETHITELTDSSRQAILSDFKDIETVPRKGITMGIKTIMSAKQIILLANGKAKREIIEKALHGPVTEDVPASILQKHPQVTIILDSEAAGLS